LLTLMLRERPGMYPANVGKVTVQGCEPGRRHHSCER
jgi:hypothetical protein